MTHRVAFIQFGAAGDILFATPILRELRARYPDSEITWMVRDVFKNLLDTNPRINHVRCYALPSTSECKQLNEGYMLDQIKEDARAYDLIASPQMWPDHNYYRSNRHLVDMMAENVFGMGYTLSDHSMEIFTTTEDRNSIDDRFGFLFNWNRAVTINHISYAASPVWNPGKYETFARLLLENNLTPVFAGSKTDPLPNVEGIVDARGTTYREWRECIARSAVWFGLDTSAKGLAATTTTPMIVLQSKDFPLTKTGIVSCGIRKAGVLELTVPITEYAALELIKDRVGPIQQAN